MMKKVWVLAASAALCLSLSACGGTMEQLPALSAPGDASSTASTTASGEESSVASGTGAQDAQIVSDGEFEDNLDGLCTYLEENHVVIRDDTDASFTEMSYKEIGAAGGYRYRFRYGSATIQTELYEFDLEHLEERGKACLDSVKEKGTFTVLDNEVPATLSENGKYLLIFNSTGKEDTIQDLQEKQAEVFRKFKAQS